MIGAAAGEAGSSLWISFVLAGIAAFLTALSYAELTSALHETGAEYQFMKAAFPRWRFAAFMAGFLIVLNAAATAATVALAFAGYLATASTALISLVSISRMLLGMARGGDAPKPLAWIWGRRRTPWMAALALFAAAFLLLPLGEVKIVASISSFAVLLVFIGVHAAVIALRYRMPRMKRLFTVPLSWGRFPVPSALGAVIAMALATQFEPIVYAVAGGAIAVGAAIYSLRRWWPVGGTVRLPPLLEKMNVA